MRTSKPPHLRTTVASAELWLLGGGTILLGGAFLLIGSALGAVLGALGAIFFARGLSRIPCETTSSLTFLSLVVAIFTVAFLIPLSWTFDALMSISPGSGFWGVGGVIAVALFSALQFVAFVFISMALRRCAVSTLVAIPFSGLFLDVFYPQVVPWQLGYAFTVWEELLPLAYYVGVEGVGGLLWFIAALAARVSESRLAAAWCVSILTLVHLVGNVQLATREGERSLSLLLVGGNLPMEIREEDDVQRHARAYGRKSTEAARPAHDLIVWPESSVPFLFDESSQPPHETLASVTSRRGRPLLFGGSFATPSGERRAAAFLVANDPQGNVESRTLLKRYPMPGPEGGVFGLIDLITTLPPLRLAPQVVALASGGGRVSAGVMICFESTLPNWRDRWWAAEAPDFLIETSNHVWLGRFGSHQHRVIARWRAAEIRRPMVRVVNGGTSVVVDRFGREVDTFIAPRNEVVGHEVRLPLAP